MKTDTLAAKYIILELIQEKGAHIHWIIILIMVTDLEFQYGENIIELEANFADDLECELFVVFNNGF